MKSLQAAEKKINSEIVRLLKAVNVASVTDSKKSALNKPIYKPPLLDLLGNLVELLDTSLILCKAAATSVD